MDDIKQNTSKRKEEKFKIFSRVTKDKSFLTLSPVLHLEGILEYIIKPSKNLIES